MAPQTRSSTARNFDNNHIGHNNGRKTLNNSKNVTKNVQPTDDLNNIYDLNDDGIENTNDHTIHANGITNQCSKCSSIFEKIEQLCKHLKSEHNVIQCPKCLKEFLRKSHLERHIRDVCFTSMNGRSAKKFNCSFCDRKFTRHDNLQQHIRKKHSEHVDKTTSKQKKFDCKVCGKYFNTPSHVIIHERIHTGEKPFKCSHCEKSFNNNGALQKHNRVHTGEKPYECNVCGYRFALQGTLSRHSKIHTGIRPHKCEFCGKEFIQASNLKAHLFFHTGQNGFKCDQCDKQFNRKSRLTLHKKYLHEKEKPFICPSCKKAFTRKEDLSRHLFLHTGLKNHHCVYCTKSFAIKASLNVHMLTHRKEEPISCKKCSHAFIRKDCLKRHIRKAHRDEADDLLIQHCFVDKRQYTNLNKENSQLINKMEYRLVQRKISDDKLCQAIRELLAYVVNHELLQGYGWPNKPVDLLLESLIKQCNHEPVKAEDYNFYDRLRENVKLLFTVVIEDESLKETLEMKTVDEVIADVIQEASEVRDP
ncbi:translation initiation factor eif-2b subunit delta-like protein [Dermatophagoides farinae]|uniref:Protein krueppel n=1 Tax=Dermatophagoides farinae TaxID=6954 RepID=A0A9D4NT31_DERFA|nr:translation initiation factor eif-2b subunit delta-like protein [Dermatophagoides farinae]